MAGPRVILHVDMNAFFVSVELLHRPDLVGRPVVVGGTGRRGVVAAASYEARQFGVHSAMSSVRARQLCSHAVFLGGNYDEYSRVSLAVREILGRFSPKVEPVSIDEAFVDVSGALSLFGSGVDIGHRIRHDIDAELGVPCSVGVAPNKFLAKMASVEAKPRAKPDRIEPGHGVFEVRPGEEIAYLRPLPIRRLWGVGPKTYERLRSIGITTIGDLADTRPAALRAVLGAHGAEHLRTLAHGTDIRPVEVERAAKSIGHEETYPTDLFETDELHTQLMRLADAVASRLRAAGVGARTITLKVRDATFTTVSRARTVPIAVDTAPAIAAVARSLMESVEPVGGVRLLGISTSKFAEPAEQLALDLAAESEGGGPEARWSDASRAIDEVRARFGAAAIGSASALGDDGVTVLHRGRNPWGPNR